LANAHYARKHEGLRRIPCFSLFPFHCNLSSFFSLPFFMQYVLMLAFESLSSALQHWNSTVTDERVIDEFDHSGMEKVCHLLPFPRCSSLKRAKAFTAFTAVNIFLLNQQQQVQIFTTKSGGMFGIVSSRDFCRVRTMRRLDNGVVKSLLCSTAHSKVPSQQGYVRGLNHPSGMILRPLPTAAGEPPLTEVTSIAQIDAGGSVPEWVSNYAYTNLFGFSLI
jgi:hypothetical protein